MRQRCVFWCPADVRLHGKHQVWAVNGEDKQDIVAQQLSEALVERRFPLGAADVFARQSRKSEEFLLVGGQRLLLARWRRRQLGRRRQAARRAGNQRGAYAEMGWWRHRDPALTNVRGKNWVVPIYPQDQNERLSVLVIQFQCQFLCILSDWFVEDILLRKWTLYKRGTFKYLRQTSEKKKDRRTEMFRDVSLFLLIGKLWRHKNCWRTSVGVPKVWGPCSGEHVRTFLNPALRAVATWSCCWLGFGKANKGWSYDWQWLHAQCRVSAVCWEELLM